MTSLVVFEDAYRDWTFSVEVPYTTDAATSWQSFPVTYAALLNMCTDGTEQVTEYLSTLATAAATGRISVLAEDGSVAFCYKATGPEHVP